MRGLNIPPTSYLLPPARCAVPCEAMLRPVPCEAMRRAVPCEAMLRPERRDAPPRATRRARPSGPFLLRFSTQASLRAERSILAPLLYASVPSGRAVHCPLSIIHYPFPILPSHTAKLQHGEGEIKHFAQTMPRGPRFPSCLPSQRAHCQPLSGKWAFVLCPCPSRP